MTRGPFLPKKKKKRKRVEVGGNGENTDVIDCAHQARPAPSGWRRLCIAKNKMGGAKPLLRPLHASRGFGSVCPGVGNPRIECRDIFHGHVKVFDAVPEYNLNAPLSGWVFIVPN